jgi:RNA polymerase sigma-70 factor (ECF subfamily)
MKPPTDETVAQLFGAHSRALLLYARQWTDAAGAEDVVQRVFVRMLSGGRIPTEPRTWLFRCVRNEAISAARSNRRRQQREQATSQSAPAWFVPQADDRIDAALAQEALRSLAPEQREIVALRIWSGLTLAQISEVIGMPVSSVHHQFNLAMKTLRERLEATCPKNKT